MTKQQLIATLEPFDNEIDILILDDKNYKREPRMFYYFGPGDDNAQILLVTSFPPQGKAVELKIK
jgi:hypothetical protein